MIKTLLIIYCSFAYGYGLSMFFDIIYDNKADAETKKEIIICDLFSLGILLIFPIIWPALIIESIRFKEDNYGD